MNMDISSDDRYFVTTGYGDEFATIWSVDGRKLAIIQNIDTFAPPRFSPDCRFVLAANKKDLVIADLSGNRIRTISNAHETTWIYYTIWSPDGRYLLSSASDLTVKLWNAGAGGLVRVILKESSRSSYQAGIAFTPDGRKLIANRALYSLDGRPLQKFKVQSSYYDTRGNDPVEISPDGTFAVWGIDKDEMNFIISDFNDKVTYHGAGIDRNKHALLSSDLNYLYVYGSNLGIYSSDGTRRATLQGYAAVSPDGKYIAYSNGDELEVLPVREQDMEKLSSISSTIMKSFSFSPDGRLAVMTGSSNIVIKSTDNKILTSFSLPCSTVAPLFGPDGRHILVHCDRGEHLIDLTGRTLYSINDVRNERGSIMHHIYFAAAKGLLLDLRSNRDLRLIDYRGNEKKELQGKPFISDSQLAVSPDGEHVLEYDNFGSMHVWNIREGRMTRDFKPSGTFINRVLFMRNGRFIIATGAGSSTGHNDISIRVFDYNGTLIREMTDHATAVTDIAMTPDERFLTAVLNDGTVKIYNTQNWEQLTLLTKGSEWVMFTQDGYFDSSRNGGPLVAMVQGVNCFGIDQFALKFNRPDMMLNKIGIGNEAKIAHYAAQHARRLQKSGYSESDLSSDLHVPEAKIIESKLQDKMLTVVFQLSDDLYRLKRYNIFANDVPLFGAYGKPVGGMSAKLTEKVELTTGTNKIEVSAINEKGAESYRALTFAEYKKPVKGDLYFLGFGVSAYRDSVLNLKYADKDVKDLADMFGRMKGRYGNVFIKTFLNQEVTSENIQNAKGLLKNSRPDDTFVLFIAGHGVHDIDRAATYYYLTYDTDVKNLKGSAADFELIEDLMQGIAPRNKLFLMDTCESGEADAVIEKQYYALADSRGLKARTMRGLKITAGGAKSQPRSFLFEKDRFIYNDLSRRSGAIVFSSSRGGEFSYESDAMQNGYFTREIITGLEKTADKNNDGMVSVDELREYVARRVSDRTGGLQNPTVDRDNIYQKVVFPLAR
jgi:WD40 repeat protein